MLLCKYCNQEKKSEHSLRAHEVLCKSNPNRKKSFWETPNWQKTIPGYVQINGYIKAKKLGLPKPKISEETHKKLSDNTKNRSREWFDINNAKISNKVQAKVKTGTWHSSLAKYMHINYKGVDLHGLWELKYAEYLDRNNIKWIRNKDLFAYEFEGKKRRYTPDFYLPDTDEYIEIKGYKTDKDTAKWEQFPKHRKLVVLMKKELYALGVLNNDK